MNQLNLVGVVKMEDEDDIDDELITYRKDFATKKIPRDYWNWVGDSDFSNRDIDDKIRSLIDD